MKLFRLKLKKKLVDSTMRGLKNECIFALDSQNEIEKINRSNYYKTAKLCGNRESIKKMKENISNKLNEIFLKRTGINFQKQPQLKEENLLGKKLSIPPRELVMICADIEREFNIYIPETDYIDGNVKNYAKIERMIRRLLKF